MRSAVTRNMVQGIQKWTEYHLWKTAFKNLKWYDLLWQITSLQTFDGCLRQILLGPFLNILTHMSENLFDWFFWVKARYNQECMNHSLRETDTRGKR